MLKGTEQHHKSGNPQRQEAQQEAFEAVMNNRTILQGDVLEKLKEIESESIDCIITSPPYWGLRDYGVDGQLGLESDFRQYLEKMGVIMDELKRVLKKTGTCWVNLGDTYHTNKTWNSDERPQSIGKGSNRGFYARTRQSTHIKEKSRIGIPERFYINCIDSGWIARNHIPWYKSNSMPSSVKDRFTNKWESIFFFAKNQKYYFNLDAVREKTVTETKPFNIRVRENITGHAQAKLGDQSWKASEEEMKTHNRDGTKKQDSTLGADGKPNPTYKGFNERWKERKSNNIPGQEPHGKLKSHSGYYDEEGNCLNNPNGKNPGDVFFINPKPFPESHFATFPVELPERILRCACPDNVCKKCGKPREAIVEVERQDNDRERVFRGETTKQQSGINTLSGSTYNYPNKKLKGYTDCGCNAGFESGIVLDPFFGAGTVGVAAEKLNRQWVGIELNPDYIKIAEKRLESYRNDKLEAFLE